MHSHPWRLALILVWLGVAAFISFKRALHPPPDRQDWYHFESYRFNKNPIVRGMNVLVGLIFLALAIAAVIEFR